MVTKPVPPKTKKEADQARQALAQYDVGRIEAALEVLNGDALADVLAAIQTVLDEGLPAGTSVAANLPRLAGYFADISKNGADDLALMKRVADPDSTPPQAPAGQLVPLMPAAPPEGGRPPA